MAVRDNWKFRNILTHFDPAQSIILYSMWDGYHTKPNSTIPDFLNLAGCWASLHTSGHASHNDLKKVVEITSPDIVIPIHSDNPDMLQILCPNAKIQVTNDGEEVMI